MSSTFLDGAVKVVIANINCMSTYHFQGVSFGWPLRALLVFLTLSFTINKIPHRAQGHLEVQSNLEPTLEGVQWHKLWGEEGACRQGTADSMIDS